VPRPDPRVRSPSHRQRALLGWLLQGCVPLGWLLTAVTSCSIGPSPPTRGPEGRQLGALERSPLPGHAQPSVAAPRDGPSPSVDSVPSAPGTARCAVPSLALVSPRDGRDQTALADCQILRTGHEKVGQRCGDPAFDHPVELARLDEAVLPFNEATLAKLRALARRGGELGRRPRVFGLVGDSITFSEWFLRPFSSKTRYRLSPQVREHLRISPQGQTIVDYYRGVDAQSGLDSFAADRAAKNGAPSSWALPLGQPASASPLGQLVRTLSPSVVIVMFGSNDATVRFTSVEELSDDFRQRMTRIVDHLEGEGVIPVLNTVLRHGVDPSRSDCDRQTGDLSNWRVAVQSSAVSAVAAEIACQRNLPLIDLRHGMDGLLNSGLGTDGIHPNAFSAGAGVLTAAGLQCGFNVRNYLTLRMLRQIHEALKALPR
jgi:hypothetical protein